VDFVSIQQTNTATNYKRALRRFLAPSSPPPPQSWTWETDDGSALIPFDEDLSAYLSMARARHPSSLPPLPAPAPVVKFWTSPTVPYAVDLRDLVQMNVQTGRLRWVSVRAAAAPAVASLQALTMEKQAAAVMKRCKDVTDEVENGGEEGGEEDVCAVCMDGFGGSMPAWKLPSCKHFFHDRCIRPWLLKAGSCPTCVFRYVEHKGDQPDGQMLCFRYPPGSLPLSGHEQQGTLMIQVRE